MREFNTKPRPFQPRTAPSASAGYNSHTEDAQTDPYVLGQQRSREGFTLPGAIRQEQERLRSQGCSNSAISVYVYRLQLGYMRAHLRPVEVQR